MNGRQKVALLGLTLIMIMVGTSVVGAAPSLDPAIVQDLQSGSGNPTSAAAPGSGSTIPLPPPLSDQGKQGSSSPEPVDGGGGGSGDPKIVSGDTPSGFVNAKNNANTPVMTDSPASALGTSSTQDKSLNTGIARKKKSAPTKQ